MKKSAILAFGLGWEDLRTYLVTQRKPPVDVDTALDDARPSYSSTLPSLHRERHGWCPYSERVWLALECCDVSYDAYRIDNTGPGRKPGWWSGTTPQVVWPDGRRQGESMDLVREVDERYGGGRLYPPSLGGRVDEMADAFRGTFPSGSRPSSRAAFLFSWTGEPLFRSEFERVLEDTDGLLSKGDGPFLCGDTFTAADVAWAPFLERYAAQLPCLHDGLNPRDESSYPNLAQWYEAMDSVPAYACRVKGNASSWRKVLTMAGYGNAGYVPALVSERMDRLGDEEGRDQTDDEKAGDQRLWDEYRAARPHLARTPAAEAARVLLSNREAILADTLKRSEALEGTGVPLDRDGLDGAMRALAAVLACDGAGGGRHYGELEVAAREAEEVEGVFALARFLDERMCVPRDMGSMSAAAIKRLAAKA
ncbi:hypothetical protein THAOC_07216 [Thalassiosira oceanica]|uniref:GST C-terminal domain-containing protein n=1 Tax=Thalassiosira oceanica TaxID=159749 RepID=K0T2G6_THAOC|nr:hypothetical protein THAOC_07216 [Thalassiosira oceanica]|mmetsp:Transcript_32760/g.73687  ORF Transcript_32760/g.73687 Transcript_32760/m.73687 type:complete len:423 (-) Transcript_32760:35-1303(-)|eukprot:EJK71359.1 hypothetical protein THAOC_07216 [Thalassiosira oceanica]